MKNILTLIILAIMCFTYELSSMQKTTKKRKKRKQTFAAVTPCNSPRSKTSDLLITHENKENIPQNPLSALLVDQLQAQQIEIQETRFQNLDDMDCDALVGLFQTISINLSQKSPTQMVQHSERQQRRKIYAILLERDKDKAKTKKHLAGFADDFSDDEADLDELKEKDLKDIYQRFYENSKRKTDSVITALKAEGDTALMLFESLEAQEKAQEEKIKGLQDALQKAQEEKVEISKEKDRNFELRQRYEKATSYHRSRQKQNEICLQNALEQVKRLIEKEEEIIAEINKEIASLVFNAQSTTYTEKKRELERRKEEAMERKKDLEFKLIDITYRLPKINQPGSKSRQAYNAASAAFSWILGSSTK